MTNLELKAWRDLMKLTQRGAAEALGMTQSAYSAMERGRSYSTGKPVVIDRRTELACVALLSGLAPVTEDEKFGDLGGREPDVK